MAKNQKDLCVEELLKNNKGLEILTDTGWSKFDGLLLKGEEETVTVNIDGIEIVCTPTHKFYINKTDTLAANELSNESVVMTTQGPRSVNSVTSTNKVEKVYDIVNAGKNRRFYANDILISNCEFIIWEETLINAMHLAEMRPTDPIERQGQVRWYKKPDPTKTYAVALDPSLGTGGDPAAIQVIELQTMTQVAEWQHNKTPIQKQVAILLAITGYLCETVPYTQVYYSLENNTLGEAALVVIEEIGEENIAGIFLSEPYKSGTGRRFRKGFNTTHKVKLVACSKLKTLIESSRMTVNSAALIGELKTFVAHGTSYAAKPGETDDLVMSLVLAIRMAQQLQSYDPELDSYMKDRVDDFDEPMPFIML